MTLVTPFAFSIAAIVVLACCGVPIGLAMLAASLLYLAASGQDLALAAETLLQGLYHGYTLLAIPLFILAAELMNVGTISDRLLSFCNAVVGRLRGGLGHVNVLSSLIFSGMSGSAVADAVGVGRLVISMMTRDGRYTPSYAAAITAASATIGPIIPPSIPLVLYALISDASIGYLFLAGVGPGLLMAAAMMALNAWLARVRGFPVEPPVPLRELPRVTKSALPALLMPVVLLGGLYSGVMTPTEAAAVAALYALAVSAFLYRSVSPRQLYLALLGSGKSMAAVGMLIAGAMVFNFVIAREDIPQTVSRLLAAFELTPLGFLLLTNVLLLILGCLLEAGAILLIVVPILLPTAKALGVDLVHFGIVVTVNLMIGLVTPPYGLLLFIVANITRQPLRAVVRELLPFIVVLIGVLALITLVPDIALGLPRQFGYRST
jgi:tripartite ATP-independent transporter DctM subunit